MSFLNEIRQNIVRSGKVTYQLIAINVAIFLFFGVLFVFEKLIFRSNVIEHYYHYYLALPASPDILMWHPWSILSYMFLHSFSNFFHIVFNMLFLYWFGLLLEEYLGRKRIIGLYLLGGIAGGLLYIISYNIFPYLTDQVRDAYLIGASASVMAILVGCATMLPNHTFFLLFFGPVRLKYIALIIVAFDFLSIAGYNPGGMIAHLGGALFGFLFIRRLRQGQDWSEGLAKLFRRIGNIFRRRPVLRVKHTNRGRKAPTPDSPRQDEIDLILDKISRSGYESLSKEEKNKLFKASKD